MQLLIFKYQEENSLNDLTTVEIDGEIWFVAADVCRLLDLKNVSEAISGLDADEKLTSELPRAGQNRKVNLINESGLYSLIFRSNKDSAKKFRKWVTKEVLPSIRKKGSYGINRQEPANFIIRYNDNWDRIENGYFSVISELFVRLNGRFHHVGYDIPNKGFQGKEIRPDVSVGQVFARYLNQNHPSVCKEYKMYSHIFPNGLEVECRQYKLDLLPIFIRFVDNVWIPQHAERYFKERDLKALDYLPKLLKAS